MNGNERFQNWQGGWGREPSYRQGQWGDMKLCSILLKCTWGRTLNVGACSALGFLRSYRLVVVMLPVEAGRVRTRPPDHSLADCWQPDDSDLDDVACVHRCAYCHAPCRSANRRVSRSPHALRAAGMAAAWVRAARTAKMHNEHIPKRSLPLYEFRVSCWPITVLWIML